MSGDCSTLGSSVPLSLPFCLSTYLTLVLFLYRSFCIPFSVLFFLSFLMLNHGIPFYRYFYTSFFFCNFLPMYINVLPFSINLSLVFSIRIPF